MINCPKSPFKGTLVCQIPPKKVFQVYTAFFWGPNTSQGVRKLNGIAYFYDFWPIKLYEPTGRLSFVVKASEIERTAIELDRAGDIEQATGL